MPADTGAAARAAAARILHRVRVRGQKLADAFAAESQTIPTGETAFVRELCWGSARLSLRLDHWVSQTLQRPLPAKNRDLHALMMIGAYQLGWMRVPARAAVHATVAATANLHKPWARGLVNAVLRKLSKLDLHSDELPAAARFSHPPWLLDMLRRDWPQQWQEIARCGNQRPPLTLRVGGDARARQSTRDALQTAGLHLRAGHLADSALYVSPPQAVADLPGFAEGRISVQDEAAQLAAGLLAPHPGARILDACAAPGGKALHLLQQTAAVDLLALDTDAQRIALIQENLQRCGVQAQLVTGDAQTPQQWWDGTAFDYILLDAPCSATGILRRQPDIRLLRRARDIQPLTEMQLLLLQRLWPLLKPGGTLLYCVCSVLKCEGATLVQTFLNRQADARPDPLPVTWGQACGAGRQLLPRQDEYDGFFYARLTRSLTACEG